MTACEVCGRQIPKVVLEKHKVKYHTPVARPTSLPPDKLIAALIYIEDVLDRASVPFIVGGLLSECLYHQAPLDADGIDILIKKKYLTHFNRSTLATYLGGDREDYNESFNVTNSDVPIRVQVVVGEYDFLKYADNRFLGAGDYKIPNSFEDYWDNRHNIK